MTDRKGIILAGGSGTRLYPLTKAISKHLLQLWDKPIIYYPLCVLMLAGIREIAIITAPKDRAQFTTLLGDGSDLGITIKWITQDSPDGLAQAYILAEAFLDGHSSAMILGDNVHYGHGLPEVLRSADRRTNGATIFAHQVANPEHYGVVSMNTGGSAIAVAEKPENPESNHAITGLYFFDAKAPEWAKQVAPSERGELEITSLIEKYLEVGELEVEMMGRGYTWLDTGTKEGLVQAGEFVRTIEHRQGLKIGCPEEVAFHMGFINEGDLHLLAEPISETSYGQYLLDIVHKESSVAGNSSGSD